MAKKKPKNLVVRLGPKFEDAYTVEEGKSMKRVTVKVSKYSEDQPRDYHGRWGNSGSPDARNAQAKADMHHRMYAYHLGKKDEEWEKNSHEENPDWSKGQEHSSAMMFHDMAAKEYEHAAEYYDEAHKVASNTGDPTIHPESADNLRQLAAEHQGMGDKYALIAQGKSRALTSASESTDYADAMAGKKQRVRRKKATVDFLKFIDGDNPTSEASVMKVQIIKSSLNSAGHGHAAALVKAGKVDKTSDWSFSAEDGNKLLGSGGDDWGEYSKWFMGVDSKEDGKTKGHYKYPFGKNGKVYRKALIAIKSRAAQQKDTDIYNAAAALLEKVDGKEGGKALAMNQRMWATLNITSMKTFKATDDDDDEQNFDEDQTGRDDQGMAGHAMENEEYPECPDCGYMHDPDEDCPEGQDGKNARPTGGQADDDNDETPEAIDVLGTGEDPDNEEYEEGEDDDPEHEYDEEEDRKPAMAAAARIRRKRALLKRRKAYGKPGVSGEEVGGDPSISTVDGGADDDGDDLDKAAGVAGGTSDDAYNTPGRKPAMVIEGIASTPSTDRMGDIVETLGAQFNLPIPFLWQHDATQPLGHVTFAKPTKDGIPVTIEIPDVKENGALRDRLHDAMQSLKYGLVKGLSIGFSPVEYNYMEDTGGYRFVKWNWYELSAVTIPANMEANIAAIKSLDIKRMKKVSKRPVIKVSKYAKTPQRTFVKEKPRTQMEHNADFVESRARKLGGLK